MGFLKNNISWIAPTGAIIAVGFMVSTMPNGISGVLQNQTPEPRVDAAPSDLDQLSATVVAALAEPVTAAAPMPDSVTRNAPVDLLEIAPRPESAPEPVALAAAPAPQVDTEAAAAFFNAAQDKLAVANACGEDLKALAAQARIHFPAGAAAGEEAGFNAARLIGIVAKDCPGFAVRVEGHSDASGDPVSNQRLSEQRAKAVITRLGASGIDTTQFFAVGYGDKRPSGLTGPESSAYYDRRVEFSIVERVQQASFSAQPKPWGSDRNVAACARDLAQQAQQMRQFYAPGTITVPVGELRAVYDLAASVTRCDGARLRLVGQHENQPGTREGPATGRLRALAMMNSLVAAGYPGDRILIGAPSRSVDVPGQPGLPNSRIDFQIIVD